MPYFGSPCFFSSMLSVAQMEGVLQGYFLEIMARGDNQIVHTYEHHYSIGWMGVKGGTGRNRYGLASILGAISGTG